VHDAATGGWPADLLALVQTLSGDDSTIVVPNNERWIVQGQLGPDGVPVKLDARLSSGSPIDPSEASIVVRHVRFSGQRAAIEENLRFPYNYLWSNPVFANGEARLGGAFYYYGGAEHPEAPTPALIFEHVVFDHNWAVTGGAFFALGRDDAVYVSLKVTIESCLFFWNTGLYSGAAMSMWDFFPMNIAVNSANFIHNQGYADPNFIAMTIRTNLQYTTTGGQNHAVGFSNTNFEGPAFAVLHSMIIGAVTGVFEGKTYLLRDQFWDIAFDHTSFTDIGAATEPGVQISNLNNPDRSQINVRVIDTQASGIHGLPYSGVHDKTFGMDPNAGPMTNDNALVFGHTAVLSFGFGNSPHSIEIVRLSIEDCGALDDDTMGEGVLYFGGGGSPVASVVDSTFRRNKAAIGAVISMSSTTTELLVTRCSFVENVAVVSGGAISLKSPIGRYVVRDSIFLTNAVVPAPGTLAAYVLRLSTSASGVGTPTSPLWSLDDGPVFGLSFEECERTRRISEAGVHKEVHPYWEYGTENLGPPASPLAPTWPNTGCANVTYHPQKLYAHTIDLNQGPHRLHIGCKMRDIYPNWLGDAFIDVIGLGAVHAFNPFHSLRTTHP
jgi:hypothetical protein